MQKTGKPNPYVPGSEDWHRWNLVGDSWGYVETFTETLGGVYATGLVYVPTALTYDPQRARNNSLVVPDEFIDLWDPNVVDWLKNEMLREFNEYMKAYEF